MHVAVLGAGSVGCFIGGAWAAAEVKVTLIGRERIGAAIAEHGLSVTDHSGWRRHIPAGEVDFVTKPAALAKADVIALCVKSNDTADAAKEIARHGKKDALVLSFQNGVSNPETLEAALARRGFPIAQGMVPFNIAYLGNGRFHKGVAGELAAADMTQTRALAEAVGKGPAQIRLRDDMPALAWGKLLINLNNAVNALSGRTLLDQLKERDYRRIVAASILEALDVLEAAGIEPAQIGPIPPKLFPHAIGSPDWLFNNVFLKVQKIDAHARSSMADDLKAGRRTEIDYLNGEVVKLGQKLGLKTPINAAIVALVRQAEAGVEHLLSPEALKVHVLRGHKVAPLFGY